MKPIEELAKNAGAHYAEPYEEIYLKKSVVVFYPEELEAFRTAIIKDFVAGLPVKGWLVNDGDKLDYVEDATRVISHDEACSIATPVYSLEEWK